MEEAGTPYFRQDQGRGVSPPNLLRDCSFAEHIVRARGKRTRFTSISLDPNRIRDFGDTLYQLQRVLTVQHGHAVVEHATLIEALRGTARSGEKEERARALQAIRYARQRAEGLVDWRFQIDHIERKDLEQ